VRGHNYLYSSYRGLRSGVRLYLAGVYIQTGFSNVGFRLADGVIRGGGYSSQDTANFRVDGIRINSYQLYRGMSHIGFRFVNGVYRGSCYVRTERCPRSGTKHYYYTHNMSGGTVGFRLAVDGVVRGGQYGNPAARLKQRANVVLSYTVTYTGFRL